MMTKWLRRAWRQWTVSQSTVIVGSAVLFAVAQNLAFWAQAWALLTPNSGREWLFLASMAVFLVAALTFIFGCVLWRFSTKLVLTVFLLASAGTNYFALSYGIYMDKSMVANVFETTGYEALTLFTPKFALWMTLFGVLPSLLVWRLRIVHPGKLWQRGLKRLALILGSALLVLAVSLPIYQDYASFIRNNKQIVKLLTPSSYINGVIGQTKQIMAKSRPLVRIGEDARRIPVAVDEVRKKSLLILVVGETSRAQSFSLNGYERETNPRLQQQPDLINFRDVSSCGTATAVSLPCMFSNMPRREYAGSTAEHQENLVDVLQRAGINLFWRENDSGCKGVCARIPTQEVSSYVKRASIGEGLFDDELMLQDLEAYIDQQTDDTVIVLNTNGSHGPAYYQRYKETMAQFKESCRTNQIQDCSRQSLVNVYDNTILHVDLVLDQTIALLKKYQTEFDTAMLYLSDHGESLGESGMYLHGTPYAIAPKEQTQVPMMLWTSPGFLPSRQINAECVREKAQNDTFSQDYLFHSMLRLMRVETTQYNAKLDLFNGCDQGPV
ncbi:MAG: phosphoethanolamine transferase EptA [Neisseriaceae bacterium]|nr:phosphoethanolamine transferase EptA [Neisseriaceae bacterium]